MTQSRLAEIREALEVHGEYGGAEPEYIARTGLEAVETLEEIVEVCSSDKDPKDRLTKIAKLVGVVP